MRPFDENICKGLFSKTSKSMDMNSCIYFTATRNTTTGDIVHVFENVLNLGIIYQEYINIVPVLNKNYNHIFFKIRWNDEIATVNFVNELIVNSYIKVFHNKGYWVCRMSKNPLKIRHTKPRIHVASFYCDNSDSEQENITINIKEINTSKKVSTNEEDKVSTNEEDKVSTNEEDKVSTNEEEEEEDFYVIKEEVVPE